MAYNGLAIAFIRQKKLDKGIDSFHEALRCNPGDAMAHANLGRALIVRGKLEEGSAGPRKAHDLARNIDPGRVRQSENFLAETEQQVSQAERLPAVLSGKLKAANASEMLGFALLCHGKKLHAPRPDFRPKRSRLSRISPTT